MARGRRQAKDAGRASEGARQEEQEGMRHQWGHEIYNLRRSRPDVRKESRAPRKHEVRLGWAQLAR